MNIEPLIDKLTSFGCNVFSVDGHNTKEIIDTITSIKQKNTEGPSVLIAHTIKGHGISFCAKDLSWHYRVPTKLELDFVNKNWIFTEHYKFRRRTDEGFERYHQ
jgi:transketolase